MAIAGVAARRLDRRPPGLDELPRTPRLRTRRAVAAAAVAALVGFALYKPADEGVRGTVSIAEVAQRPGPRGQRHGPARSARRGRRRRVAHRDLVAGRRARARRPAAHRSSPGVYETTEPVPRVRQLEDDDPAPHTATRSPAIPIYLPEDAAIPVPEVPATAARPASSSPTTRSSSASRRPLRAGCWAVAYAVVLGITLAFLVLLAWGLHRLAKAVEPSEPQRSEARRSPAPAGSPIGATR